MSALGFQPPAPEQTPTRFSPRHLRPGARASRSTPSWQLVREEQRSGDRLLDRLLD
ncbi:hypothetical protein GFS31_23550 [Leptolyngbya sp. BL0902]|nr:hypothetical protein GFS31_23550 [Leptolyngbya sp. BL0902]